MQESNFLLEKMIEKEMINLNIVKTRKHYILYIIKLKEINSLNINSYQFNDEIKHNIDKLSKNDWELHKQLIKEGVNPNEISKIIRNDDIEKLQEISSQPNFTFTQLIRPSLYERCSYINQNSVTLNDFAAFFGSINCFKYLLLNHSRLMNTGKYAVAGRNLEIIHLCEQSHSSLSNSFENVIEFHQNDIFNYIYENKIFGTSNINYLVRKCISSYNYELILFFLNEKIKIDEIIYELIKSGDIFFVKCLLGNIEAGKVLIASSENGHTEIVKLLLDKEGIDVNAKNYNGYTALMFATWNGITEMAQLLLEQKGIDIYAKNEDGRTALDIASFKNENYIKNLIISKQKELKNNIKSSTTICIFH